MFVLATAGHVDHGKSALIRALTGSDPDRLAEEKRRGLTVDLGFAATELPGCGTVGFVDVPGHHRFLANTLSGIATAPAVLFTVAADQGWQPQSAEHLAAVRAFGIRSGVLVVTRSDLADPAPLLAGVRERVADSGLHDAPVVAVSARTGAGLGELREVLAALATAAATTGSGTVQADDPRPPVRLWLDRSFTVRGAGTVVTGTLTRGVLTVDDTLELAPEGRRVSVRGLQCFGAARKKVAGPARVAVNLRRVPAGGVHRGHALVTPGRWWRTSTVDVRLVGREARELPDAPLVHCGTALVAARVRPLGGPVARLRLRAPLDLHVGDRLLLRDPGSRQLTGARVLDPAPPDLTRRGAARARARGLAAMPPDGRDTAAQLRLRGRARTTDLEAMGLAPPDDVVTAGGWLLDPACARRLHAALEREVDAHARVHPETAGLPVSTAAQRLDLPVHELVSAICASGAGRPGGTGGPARPGLVVRDGRVHTAEAAHRLPPAVTAAAERLAAARHAAGTPFHAPTRPELTALGVTPQALAALVRHGVLERYGPVHLPAGSARRAAALLRTAPQPFGVGDCCRALATTRRVVIPLLEHLDRAGVTRRDADGRRLVRDETAAVEGPEGPGEPPVSS